MLSPQSLTAPLPPLNPSPPLSMSALNPPLPPPPTTPTPSIPTPDRNRRSPVPIVSRFRAIRAVERGRSQSAVARDFGVTPGAVSHWWKKRDAIRKTAMAIERMGEPWMESHVRRLVSGEGGRGVGMGMGMGGELEGVVEVEEEKEEDHGDGQVGQGTRMHQHDSTMMMMTGTTTTTTTDMMDHDQDNPDHDQHPPSPRASSTITTNPTPLTPPRPTRRYRSHFLSLAETTAHSMSQLRHRLALNLNHHHRPPSLHASSWDATGAGADWGGVPGLRVGRPRPHSMPGIGIGSEMGGGAIPWLDARERSVEGATREEAGHHDAVIEEQGKWEEEEEAMMQVRTTTAAAATVACEMGSQGHVLPLANGTVHEAAGTSTVQESTGTGTGTGKATCMSTDTDQTRTGTSSSGTCTSTTTTSTAGTTTTTSSTSSSTTPAPTTHPVLPTTPFPAHPLTPYTYHPPPLAQPLTLTPTTPTPNQAIAHCQALLSFFAHNDVGFGVGEEQVEMVRGWVQVLGIAVRKRWMVKEEIGERGLGG